MSQPPRDEKGQVVPHDHEEILSEHGIIRRISRHFVVQDAKVIGGKRLSTMAFEPSSTEYGSGLSVDLENAILEFGIDACSFVSNPPWIGSVYFTVKQLRDLALLVGYSPVGKTPQN